MKYVAKFTAAIFLFIFITCSVYAGTSSQPQDQSQSQPASSAGKQAAPSAESIQRAIEDAYRQEPKMHHSRVSVQVKSKEIWLRGVVLTHEAELLAVQIAKEHAGGRKIVDHLKVNPNTHPGTGL